MLQIKSKYKVCKRLGSSVFEQCQTQKFSLSESRSRKQRGKRPRRGMSDYGKQLLEKQKLRYTYGLSEKQLRTYVAEAMNASEPARALFSILESRLDNVLYRIGMAPTRRAARQMASHGHMLVNGRKTTVPSQRLRAKDTIGVREGSKDSALFEEFKKEGGPGALPNWVRFDLKALSGEITGEATPSPTDTALNFPAVLEYYSR